MTFGEIIIMLLLAVLLIMQLVQLIKPKINIEDKLSAFSEQNNKQLREIKADIVTEQKNMNEIISANITGISDNIIKQQGELRETTESAARRQEDRFKTYSAETEQKLENIRATLENRLKTIQGDNNQKLDEMRKVVDEKLQTTLDRKISESFKQVNDRLEQVYKGLGEMQSLASGVGDLKKVLTNVKTRGILGEIQLGAILEDILAPEQYDTNCAVVKNSKNVVEFAVKIPVQNGGYIYLPIDSKFPGDTYSALTKAYESGDKAAVDMAAKLLCARIKSEAKDIKEKYIYPPDTTEFAIMFLPFEGLYSEVVNRGLLEELQRTYRVTVAGPSTMAAMLCSIRMCYRNVAIQRYSSEVWELLSAVKSEFATFENVLLGTQKKLNSVSDELDKLIGVRTRQINKKLSKIDKMELDSANKLLEIDDIT